MSDLTRSLPIQRRAATIAPESINEEDRSVEIVWTTGARRVTWSFDEGAWGGLIEEELDLAGADLSRLNAGAPFLKNHASWSIDNVLGVHVDGSAVIDEAAKVGRARVRFAKDPDTEVIWQKVKDKILRQTSVGYSVDKYVVTREEGRLPLYRAVSWTPLENSLVTIGADPGAQVRSAGAEPQLYPCVVVHQRAATATPKPKEAQAMIPNQNKAANQTKARAMDDATKTSCTDILKEYITDEAKVTECADKIAALWPEEKAADAPAGDMAEAARALGVEGEVTVASLTKAALNLRTLFDAQAKELGAAQAKEEEDEFTINEKKGLHRKLDGVRKGFARELYDGNKVLYRTETGKVKPLTGTHSPTTTGERNTIAKVAASTDDFERKVNARAKELMTVDKLSENDAHRRAFRELQPTMAQQ